MNDMDTILLSYHLMVGGEWRNFRPHGTCSIAAGDLSNQSLPGAQNPLLYDRQAAPLEMTMRRVAYCH